jgi:hypothetical protein
LSVANYSALWNDAIVRLFEAIDIDMVLAQTLGQSEMEELLAQFSAENYREAKEHPENEKMRKKLVRKCAEWLMVNCQE